MPAAKKPRKTAAKPKAAILEGSTAKLLDLESGSTSVNVAAPTDVPINPASLARRKRELLDIIKDPDTPGLQYMSARYELARLDDVPILSHHEIKRLG